MISLSTAWLMVSATASPSTGLSPIPVPVARQTPSTGTTPPSHTVHRAALSRVSGGNCMYLRVPVARSVPHTPGCMDGSSSCHRP